MHFEGPETLAKGDGQFAEGLLDSLLVCRALGVDLCGQIGLPYGVCLISSLCFEIADDPLPFLPEVIICRAFPEMRISVVCDHAERFGVFIYRLTILLLLQRLVAGVLKILGPLTLLPRLRSDGWGQQRRRGEHQN